MPTIPWLESFSIGHGKIDEEHRALIDATNAIDAELAAGRSGSAKAQCRALRAALQKHFKHEEKLLREAGFPRVGDHIRGHTDARDEIDRIVGDCAENCRVGPTIGCTARLCVAILNHVLIADLDFKSYLQDRGVARPG